MPKKSCRTELSRKIAINMAEYKEGRYKSPAQAIAVAYSQVQKKRPACKKSLKKKSKKSMKKKSMKKSMKKSKKARTKKQKSA
jgi:hypothetical protein